MPKTFEVEKSSLHPQIYGIISSYIKRYKKKLQTRNFQSEEPEKAIIIQSPAGTGKTHFIRQIAADFNLRLLELGVSNYRNKMNVCKILGEASQTFSIDQGENHGTIIFIDDIDVVLEPDKGFYQGIESIIAMTKCPVLMACVQIPEALLSHKLIKVFRFENFKGKTIEMVHRIRDSKVVRFSELEIENIYYKTQGNLHRIHNCFSVQVRVN